MHYTTVAVALVEGQEAQGIDDGIAQGLKVLSEEISGPVELVNVAFAPLDAPAHSLTGGKLCVTVMVRPYRPMPLGGGVPVQDVFMHVLRENRLV